MLNYFFSQLTRSFGVIFRTLRAFFMRRMAGLITRLRRVVNFSRSAAKATTGAIQSAVSVSQKPSKREDYVETGSLLISKALIVRALVVLLIFGFACYFFVWPFVLSRFLTARFFVKDSRLEDWNGKVIVYADKQKKLPMYAGRLEEGVLQGRGRAYDENGVLSYEGDFLSGLKNGMGRAYQDGQLIYEGSFLADVYSGEGRLYADGMLCYEGDFANGFESGNGTGYDDSGVIVYRGQFEKGMWEGTGTAYAADGTVRYQGGFSQNVYHGSGTLFLGDGERLEAQFAFGAPDGLVRWTKGGMVYYSGEWADGPSGFGTLYDRRGRTLYEGQMAQGSVDGAWLLSLGAEELRESLGASVRTGATLEDGYLLHAPELGLSARCTFRTESEDSTVKAVYLYAPQEAGWVDLLPGGGQVSLQEDLTEATGEIDFTVSEELPLQGQRLCRVEEDETLRTVFVYPSEEEQCAMVIWTAPDDEELPIETPEEEPGGPTDSAGEDRMEALLDSLAGLGSAEGAAQSVESAYCGEEDPTKALDACKDTQQATALIEQMLSYWSAAQTQSALEDNLVRLEAMLTEARTALSRGEDAEAAIAALEEQKTDLTRGVESAQAQRIKAELAAKDLGCESVSDYALGDMALRFDLSKEDTSGLLLRSTAYAQAAGKDNWGSLETDLKNLMVDLTDLNGEVDAAAERYQAASAAAKAAAAGYATGNADKTAWFTALSAQAEARSALCTAIANFTQKANALNALTGGWVSETYQWYAEEFGALTQAEMSKEE